MRPKNRFLTLLTIILSQRLHHGSAFWPLAGAGTRPSRTSRKQPSNMVLTAQASGHHGPGETSGVSVADETTVAIAGTIWPALRKFHMGPGMAKQIFMNILSITHWQDLALLSFLALALDPLSKFSYDRLPMDSSADEEKRAYQDTYVATVTGLVSEASKIALSVYIVDVLSVSLTTLGFRFPQLWKIPHVFAKLTYTVWASRKFLALKRAALCRMFHVKEVESMGRVEIINRILNGATVALVSLLLLDWLSIEWGVAMKSVLAFGSVGTLAFTLASQGLVSQLLSGLFLTFSDKMYVNDSVKFGDGTSGQILDMGWMETTLRGSDNIITRVPNSLLAAQKVSNLSRLKQSQVTQTLRFHYEDADKIPALLDTMRQEIKDSCSRLIVDGTRPFRVFWTNINEDHLEVMVDTHHNIAPMGDAYYINRQAVLMAINRAVKKHNIRLAELIRVQDAGTQPDWRVKPPAMVGGRSSRTKKEDDSDSPNTAHADDGGQ